MTDRLITADDTGDDWLDAALREDGLAHRADYLDDDGFTSRVMARLPAPATLPAWRKPVLARPLGRGGHRRRRRTARHRDRRAARDRPRVRASGVDRADRGGRGDARRRDVGGRGIRAQAATDRATQERKRPPAGGRLHSGRCAPASVVHLEVDVDLADVFLALGVEFPAAQRDDDGPVEIVRRIGADDRHFGDVALLVDHQAGARPCPRTRCP